MAGITTHLKVRIFEGPKSAPSYASNTTGLRISEALVVKKGTAKGRPTVDLRLIDDKGNEYVTMVTGRIVQALAGAVKGCE